MPLFRSKTIPLGEGESSARIRSPFLRKNLPYDTVKKQRSPGQNARQPRCFPNLQTFALKGQIQKNRERKT